jgi:hypothetical protein
MKQGRDSERAVGQYRELFRAEGCNVFHDIVGPNFNIGHVVICDRGIFVIETKTYSKSRTGQSKIDFNGQCLLINGKEPYKDIITQVKAATNHLKSVLKDSTGKDFNPFPVVLFPGWFIEGEGNKQGKMWVLEPKAFRKFLQAKQQVLSDSDAKLASYHLSRHIRVNQSEMK